MSRSSAGAGLCSIIRCGGIHCAVARLPTPAAIRSRLRISTSSDPLDAVMTLRRRTASPRLLRRRHARTPLEAACIAPERIGGNGSAGAPCSFCGGRLYQPHMTARTASPRLRLHQHARTPLEAACIAPERISGNGSAGAPLFILRRQAVPAAFDCAYSFPEVAATPTCAHTFRRGLHCARTHQRQRFSRRTLVHSVAAGCASRI